ncbi:MAG: tRNA (adenosine(37)-N6)-threonylcarbamoyltransferase complex transferase subunit TsaD [Puniceicoccales bacterium]|jgi:N6-L-threonylcarbamoyladenine synthase|nr:tRNA (adenosine(37)-N6)-threonylcarbamoyltransferase complex transferase subunit TsaD [Puniceicoccales bacterium]
MILGVESSCDDTGLALLDEQQWQFLYERTSTQSDLHATYGGIVPQLAAREHLRNFPMLLRNLEQHIPLKSITQIAVTCGPGLPESLALGISFARSLGLILRQAVTGIHHLRGHIMSPFIGHAYTKEDFRKKIFPHLSLLVSGGNTLLAAMRSNFEIHVLAQTTDDAAGEALDKGAKLLGLNYPGGPEIERFAALGDQKRFKFPQAFIEKKAMAFSFSGLKTSLRYMLEKLSTDALKGQFNDICASYQWAIIDILIKKMKQALIRGNFRSIGLCGGVSNNGLLRSRLQELAAAHSIPYYLPQARYTGDNASMIAFAAAIDFAHSAEAIDFYPNWPLSTP